MADDIKRSLQILSEGSQPKAPGAHVKGKEKASKYSSKKGHPFKGRLVGGESADNKPLKVKRVGYGKFKVGDKEFGPMNSGSPYEARRKAEDYAKKHKPVKEADYSDIIEGRSSKVVNEGKLIKSYGVAKVYLTDRGKTVSINFLGGMGDREFKDRKSGAFSVEDTVDKMLGKPGAFKFLRKHGKIGTDKIGNVYSDPSYHYILEVPVDIYNKVAGGVKESVVTEGYESKVLDILDQNNIDAHFHNGVLYVYDEEDVNRVEDVLMNHPGIDMPTISVEDPYDSGPEDMDGDFDSAMASAGHGSDEDYGDYGSFEEATKAKPVSQRPETTSVTPQQKARIEKLFKLSPLRLYDVHFSNEGIQAEADRGYVKYSSTRNLENFENELSRLEGRVEKILKRSVTVSGSSISGVQFYFDTPDEDWAGFEESKQSNEADTYDPTGIKHSDFAKDDTNLQMQDEHEFSNLQDWERAVAARGLHVDSSSGHEGPHESDLWNYAHAMDDEGNMYGHFGPSETENEYSGVLFHNSDDYMSYVNDPSDDDYDEAAWRTSSLHREHRDRVESIIEEIEQDGSQVYRVKNEGRRTVLSIKKADGTEFTKDIAVEGWMDEDVVRSMHRQWNDYVKEVGGGEPQMFTKLSDAGPNYAPGPNEVWYWKSEYSRDMMMGASWMQEHRPHLLPEEGSLQQTHVLIGTLAQNDLERIYMMMQGEQWSPEGQARNMIQQSGTGHTSMSMGDVIKRPDGIYMVDSFGFYKIGSGPAEESVEEAGPKKKAEKPKTDDTNLESLKMVLDNGEAGIEGEDFHYEGDNIVAHNIHAAGKVLRAINTSGLFSKQAVVIKKGEEPVIGFDTAGDAKVVFQDVIGPEFEEVDVEIKTDESGKFYLYTNGKRNVRDFDKLSHAKRYVAKLDNQLRTTHQIGKVTHSDTEEE